MATVPPVQRRGWGPRPSPALGDAVTQLSKARAGVLDLLSGQTEPVTVAQLARLAGQHHNTVREHLEALTAGGLASSRSRPAQGRGRPALLYTAVPVEQSRPQVREYSRLASAMAAHLARRNADPSTEARELGRHWGTELAGDAQLAQPADAGEAARRIIGVLGELGYDPQRVNGRVLLRQCPVLDVARRYPEVVCHIHLGVIEGLYAASGPVPDGIGLEPFAEPAGCRLYLPGLTGAADPSDPPGPVGERHAAID